LANDDPALRGLAAVSLWDKAGAGACVRADSTFLVKESSILFGEEAFILQFKPSFARVRYNSAQEAGKKHPPVKQIW
jgi:hypothetical protein